MAEVWLNGIFHVDKLLLNRCGQATITSYIHVDEPQKYLNISSHL